MGSSDEAGPAGVEPVERVGLLHGLATTRAIRRYRDEPVDDDDLARADRLARRGWWAFAAGLAAIVALFVSAAALLFSVILAVIG